jgi:hypothetical protein
MGVLADRLDNMRVRVSIPGGEISAELYGRSEIRLEFEQGYYYSRTDERELEHKLAILCRLLWVARTREYDAIVRSEGGEPIPRDLATHPLDLKYHERLDELVAEGSSVDERIRVSVRGLREWTVKIKEGALRALHEGEFIGRAADAADALIRDQLDKVRQLRQQVYNPLLNDKV